MAADDHCDRAKRYEALSAQVQQAPQGNAVLLEVNTHTGSAYHTGYVYTLVPYPPEFVMAVFTNYAEQHGHITDVLAATVEVQHGNYARVRFVYDLPWPLPHSEYVVNGTVRQEGETYLLAWDLHPSSPSGLSAPQYVEGYFRTQPVGPRTLILYCNYIIPGSGLLPGRSTCGPASHADDHQRYGALGGRGRCVVGNLQQASCAAPRDVGTSSLRSIG